MGKAPVTLIVPTYNRLDGLKALIGSIKEHTKYPYEMLITVDAGNREIYDWSISQGFQTIMSSWQRWYVGQMNSAVVACRTELFCYFNDDMLIIRSEWLEDAVARFYDRFHDGSGLLAFDVDLNRETATTGMTSKAFVRKVYGGLLFWPEYVHFSADNELTQLAKTLDKFLQTDIPVQHVRNNNPRYKTLGMNTTNDIIPGETMHWQRDHCELLPQREARGFPR